MTEHLNVQNTLARDKELCFFLQWSVIVRSIPLRVELEW